MKTKVQIRTAILCCFLLLLPEIQSCFRGNKPDNSVMHWEKIGPGGGGATFSPAISPHNSNYAFLACDMTGSFVT
jgi:hypothetical protein